MIYPITSRNFAISAILAANDKPQRAAYSINLQSSNAYSEIGRFSALKILKDKFKFKYYQV